MSDTLPVYEVTTFDVCCEGFERLRNQDEFILLACISPYSSAKDLHDQWQQDIQSCDRFDGFAYDLAQKTVREYTDRVLTPLFAKRTNPFNLEEGREDIGYDGIGCCTAFLYIKVTSNEDC